MDSRKPDDNEEGAVNPGSNLFVTGIHPRLTESDISRLFEKYGDVESCSIMVDPHTKESRGFGFVKMVTAEQADAAKEGLNGEVIEGRTLSIEKARRSRPRTPTPGKYFGPPKRGKFSYSVVQGYNSTANSFFLQSSDVDLVAAAAVVTVTMTDADPTVAAGVAAAAVVVTTTVMVVTTPTVNVVTMVVAAKAANTATILVVNTVTTTATVVVVALIATPPVVVVAVKSGTVASLAVTIVVAIMTVMLTLPATATPLLPVKPTLAAALMNPVVVKTGTVAGR